MTFPPGLYRLNVEIVPKYATLYACVVEPNSDIFEISRATPNQLIVVLGLSYDYGFTRVLVGSILADLLTHDCTPYVRTDMLVRIEL